MFFPSNKISPLAMPNQSGNGPQGGAFPGPVGSDQGHDGPSLHLSRDTFSGRRPFHNRPAGFARTTSPVTHPNLASQVGFDHQRIAVGFPGGFPRQSSARNLGPPCGDWHSMMAFMSCSTTIKAIPFPFNPRINPINCGTLPDSYRLAVHPKATGGVGQPERWRLPRPVGTHEADSGPLRL